MHRTLTITALLALAACNTAPPAPAPPKLEPTPTPIGTPIGAPVSTVIGASGGSLSSADGSIRLQIPAGALSQNQTVSIQEIENHAQGKVGKAFRLSPEGITFAKPVRLSVQLGEAEMRGVATESLRVAYQTSQGFWALPKSQRFDPQTRTLALETDHFSDWSAVAGVQLLPGQAKVKTGQTLNLQIAVCDVRDDPDNPLDGIGQCSNLSLAGMAGNWSANGVRGGNATVGTLTVDSIGGNAVYTAPAKKPAQNPVAVSANYTHDNGAQITLVSNVTIEDDDKGWSGTVTLTEQGMRLDTPPAPTTGSTTSTFGYSETFKVVAVKEVIPFPSGVVVKLALESTASALYDRTGATRWEQIGGCHVNDPPTGLREVREWSVKERLTGEGKETFDATLRIENGKYSMWLDTRGAEVKGDKVERHFTQNFCFDRKDDKTTTTPIKTNMGSNHAIRVTGSLDAQNPNALRGGYAEPSKELLIETQIKVEWNLTRSR